MTGKKFSSISADADDQRTFETNEARNYQVFKSFFTFIFSRVEPCTELVHFPLHLKFHSHCESVKI
jgi:hypothetical protein